MHMLYNIRLSTVDFIKNLCISQNSYTYLGLYVLGPNIYKCLHQTVDVLFLLFSDPISMSIYNQTVNVSSLKYEEPRAAEVRI